VTIDVDRYGIYLADLNPTRGAEIAKTRPVVVVSAAGGRDRGRPDPHDQQGSAG